jgi:hypothetical protein
MEPPDFPPNSEASKRNKSEERNLDPIVTGRVRRKRRSIRKQFSETFVAGDPRSAFQYAIFEVGVPMLRDAVGEFFHAGIDRWLQGDRRGRRYGSTPPSTPYNPLGRFSYGPNTPQQIPYNRMSAPQRALSREARARHNFDEIIIESRIEAQAVLDQLFEVVSQFEQASVADLYDLVGLEPKHTDYKWGWSDLYNANVQRVRNGYLLDLPEPQPLD